MHCIHDWEGIAVYLTGVAPFADPAFTGIATKAGRMFEWKATPNERGYCIECVELPTRRYLPTIYETATWALGLEIFVYIRRNA